MQKFITWLEGYIRHRDAVAQEIKQIKKSDSRMEVEKEGTNDLYIVELDLTGILDLAKKLDVNGCRVFLVALNNTKNIDACLKEWENLKKLPNLKILFVNPVSRSETKWLISPHVHSKVSDPDNLKNGIISLSQNVDYISSEDLKKEFN